MKRSLFIAMQFSLLQLHLARQVVFSTVIIWYLATPEEQDLSSLCLTGASSFRQNLSYFMSRLEVTYDCVIAVSLPGASIALSNFSSSHHRFYLKKTKKTFITDYCYFEIIQSHGYPYNLNFLKLLIFYK